MRQEPSEPADTRSFIEKAREAFSETDADLIIEACAFSQERIGSRDSRPFTAAELLLEEGGDAITIVAALLAPLMWENLADPDEIGKRFGRRVSRILETIQSPFLLRTDTDRHRRKDIRALLNMLGGSSLKAILLITFRLAELEHSTPPYEAAVRLKARETLDLYVPIADRLSLGRLRRRMEDTCFRILDPEGYEALRKEVAPIQAEDDKCLEILLQGVGHLLENSGIQGRLQGRTKSLYAIRRKMVTKGKTLEEIMDRVGIRIIVASVPECYAVLGLLHTHFTPIPGTFDDYIGLPKDNGYQSLHTCVYPVREISHKPIEFQVRTELMHMEAEHGSAAHWRYKEDNGWEGDAFPQKQWIKGLIHQHERTESTDDFIDLLHRQVFTDDLVVFGNGGQILHLPENATVADYLRRNNMSLSDGAVIKVNGKPVDRDHVLVDGDSIAISFAVQRK